jgi:hypothetical protein
MRVGLSIALTRGSLLLFSVLSDDFDEFVLLSLPIRVQDHRIDPRDRVLYCALPIIPVLQTVRKP